MPGCAAKWRAMSKTQFIMFAVSIQTNIAVKNRFDYRSFGLFISLWRCEIIRLRATVLKIHQEH